MKIESHDQDLRTTKTLFKTLKKQVGPSHAAGFLNALLDDASLYRGAQERGYAKWSKEERHIALLVPAQLYVGA